MVKKRKKLKEGASSKLLTRTRALNKLQLSLKDFRRLCILKGIYPRPPKKRLIKTHGTTTTFYHAKDVLFLSYEPLLQKFRDLKVFLRKLDKAKNREEKFKVKMLKKKKTKFNYDHLIRERYPSFVDALKDLDDPLSMIHLFASLPSGMTKDITGKRITRCQQIRDEFHAYLTKAGVIRKAFISIKGTYVELNIHDQKIIFIIPHQFVQTTPADVDYNVLSTFIEFYECLLKFVNFRLYKEVGLVYPPQINEALDSAGLGFTRFKTETLEEAEYRKEHEAQSPAGKEPQNIENLENIINNVTAPTENNAEEIEINEKEEEQKMTEEIELLQQDDDNNELQLTGKDDRSKVFTNLHFLLNRETPQCLLELLIRACGGQTTRLQFAKDTNSTTFTHQVIDRPMKLELLKDTREYVQPQWVVDSLNAGVLLPTAPYRPNIPPPPHLSPWVDDEKEGYTPAQALITEGWIEGKPVDENETNLTKKESRKRKADQMEKTNSEEEEGSDEEEDQTQELRKALATGKRRKLLHAMNLSKGKKDRYINSLIRKRKNAEKKAAEEAEKETEI